MSVKLISTEKQSRGDRALYLEFGGNKTVVLTYSEMDRDNLDSQTKVQAELDARLASAGIADVVFVHINREGSIAVATGAKPVVWPEDQPGPREVKGA